MKNLEKIKKLKELKEEIDNYKLDYNGALWQLQELDEDGNYINDFITYDEAEDLAYKILKNGGLCRLNCFIDGVVISADIFEIDGYGNLENCYRENLIDAINDMIANAEENR